MTFTEHIKNTLSHEQNCYNSEKCHKIENKILLKQFLSSDENKYSPKVHGQGARPVYTASLCQTWVWSLDVRS